MTWTKHENKKIEPNSYYRSKDRLSYAFEMHLSKNKNNISIQTMYFIHNIHIALQLNQKNDINRNKTEIINPPSETSSVKTLGFEVLEQSSHRNAPVLSNVVVTQRNFKCPGFLGMTRPR